MRARRLSLAVALAAAAVAAIAPAASASTADLSKGVLKYTAAPGEASHLTLSFDAGALRYVIEDTGATAISVTGSGCSAQTPHVVWCTLTSLASFDVKLGDAGSWAADDLNVVPVKIHGGAAPDTITGGGGFVTLDGGGGMDTLVAGSGITTLKAGPGGAVMTGGSGRSTYSGSPEHDEIHARNGVAESVTCGDGADAVDADDSDTVAADCESVTHGPPAPDGSSGAGATGTTPETPLAAALETVLPTQAPVVDALGRVPVEVGCPAGAEAGCDGVVTLTIPPASHSAKGKVSAARRRVVGRSKHFRLAAGENTVVPVTLLRRSARVFRRGHGRSRRQAKLVATVTIATAEGTKTFSRTISVKERRRVVKSRSRRR